jgi:hypothetical protein
MQQNFGAGRFGARSGCSAGRVRKPERGLARQRRGEQSDLDEFATRERTPVDPFEIASRVSANL